MTALSNQDIKRELGKNILIYPFNSQNMKNASYNLTASKLAWSLQTKETIYHKKYELTKKDKDGVEKTETLYNVVVIPPNTTALIETNETIWVSSKICGTYHSKVALVAKGLGHIGTTLDPEYIGNSLITVHNHSREDICIIPEQDTFASLMFYYVKTKSSIPDNNRPGRPEILKDYTISVEESQWFDESFRKYPKQLKEKLKETQEYRNIKKNLIYYFRVSILLGFIFFIALFVNILIANKVEFAKNIQWYSALTNYAPEAGFITFTAFIVQILNDIKTRENDIK